MRNYILAALLGVFLTASASSDAFAEHWHGGRWNGHYAGWHDHGWYGPRAHGGVYVGAYAPAYPAYAYYPAPAYGYPVAVSPGISFGFSAR